jgi:hypothetical protein
MGNLVSYYSSKPQNDEISGLNVSNFDKNTDGTFDPVNFSNLDEFTKEQIIEYIKTLKPKNLNLPNDYAERLKDFEIENTDLIPMCIELYQKLLDTFGEYKPSSEKSKKVQKMFFVRGKFDPNDVKKSIESPVENISTPIKMADIFLPQPSIVFMKNDDITVTEFTDSFSNILSKKDMMGVNKKVLKEMPTYLKVRFVNTLNKMMNDLTIVDKNSLGKASYIYKTSKRGPTNDINSFRQIISIPNSINHFHRILGLRLSNYMHINKFIDTNIQKGGVTGQKYAIFEQFYKIKNVLKHANKEKKSCAILFLDISNAFGNLDLQNLYTILEGYHVDKNFINYLKEFYSKFEYYVDTAGIKTETFKWKNGLVQGCSMSPLLFVIALNYILKYIDDEFKDTHGYDFGSVKILLTAFVDDICIICKNAESAEIVYNKLNELLKMLGLPINKSKSAIMTVNDYSPMNSELANIQKVNSYKYLGEYITNDGTCTESYIQFLIGISRKLKTLDLKTKMTNSDKLEIFNKIIVPWVQRKTMAMYDLKLNNRLKIISVIKRYLEKWGSDGSVNIFTNVLSIINDSDDNIISGVKFEDPEFDAELEDNIDVANYVLKNSNIKIEYSQIDDEFEIDATLADYEDLVDE